jgi:hypothetical protein
MWSSKPSGRERSTGAGRATARRERPRVNAASSEGAVSEERAAGGEQLRGVSAPCERARPRWPRGSPESSEVQVDGSGNAVNPMVGSALQQCAHRRSGESRRGGEKPRGRNETPSMARGVRWHGALASRREWTGRAENRRRGPRGGDVTMSTDGRCTRPCKSVGPSQRRRCHASKVMQSSQRARVVGLMATSGGRERDGEAARNGGGTRRERTDTFGDPASTGIPRTPDR